jgi:hypothetical protein
MTTIWSEGNDYGKEYNPKLKANEDVTFAPQSDMEQAEADQWWKNEADRTQFYESGMVNPNNQSGFDRSEILTAYRFNNDMREMTGEAEHDGTVWSDFHQKWIDEDELKKDRKSRGFGEAKHEITGEDYDWEESNTPLPAQTIHDEFESDLTVTTANGTSPVCPQCSFKFQSGTHDNINWWCDNCGHKWKTHNAIESVDQNILRLLQLIERHGDSYGSKFGRRESEIDPSDNKNIKNALMLGLIVDNNEGNFSTSGEHRYDLHLTPEGQSVLNNDEDGSRVVNKSSGFADKNHMGTPVYGEVHGSSVNGYDAKEFKNFCLVCAGRGFMYPTGAKCPNCHGTGVYDSEREYENPPPPISRDPNNPKYSPLSDQEPRTAGGGRLYEAVCEDCMGSGTKKVYNKHRVRAGDDGSFRSGHFKADYEFPCKKCSGGGYVKKEDQANTILGSEPKWQVAEGTEIEDVVPTDPYAYGNQSDREWVDPDASSDPNDDSYSSATGGYGMTEDQLYADYYSGMKEAIDREIPRMFEESGSWNYWQNLIWGWSQNVAIFGTPYSVRNSPEGLSAFQKAHKAIKQYVTDKKQEVQGTLASPSWEGRPKDKRQTQIFNAPPDNLSRLGNLKQEGDPDWTTTPDPSGNTWNEFGQKEKTSRSNYTQYHDRPRGKAEQDANRGDIEHDSLEDPLAWYNNESKVKATELDGDYVFEGEIVGRVTDFKPDEWFGKVLLFNMGEENSEYGYLDPQATVKGDDGETYEDPKGGSDGSRGTLLHDVESNLSPHNSNIVGTDRRGDYGYKACSDCKGPVALDSWGEPDESCQSCNTGGDPTNQSVEGQTVRQMTGHTGEVEYDEFGEIEPSSLTEDDWEEREKEKEEEIIRNAQQHDGEATRHGGDVCPTCDGMGEVNADGTSITAFGNEQQDGGTFKCDTCNGTGEIESTGESFTVSSPDRKQLLNQMYEDMEIDEGDCEKCKGTGLANQDDDTNCSHCDGYGLKGMKGEVKYGDKEKEHLDKIKEESEEDLSIDLKPKTEDDISQSNKDHQLLEHFR